MSDFIKPFLKGGFKKSNNYLKDFTGGAGEMSESDLETLPYLINERQKQSAKSAWLTPLDLVFKLLSMPNSVIANAVQDIGEGKGVDKILEGALKSATLQRSGSWKTTIFGGKDEGEDYEGKGLFPGQTWAKGKIPILGDIPLVKNILGTWEDAIGTLGDIFLDPTTYMTFGLTKGATAANKAAAKMATKETMKRVIFNRGNLDEIAKVASKGFDEKVFQQMLESSMVKANRYLERFVGAKEMARLNNKIYKETYKKMIQTPGAEFVREFTQGISQGGQEYLEKASAALAKEGVGGVKTSINSLKRLNPGSDAYLDRLMDLVTNTKLDEEQLKQVYRGLLEYGSDKKLLGEGAVGEALGRAGEFAGELARISDPKWAKNFSKMGERKVADLFGLELGKGVRAPSNYTQTVERMKGMISRSKIGQFGQAVMAKLDDGIVGDIKRALNIRNPYQEMLNADRMANHYTANQLVNEHMGRVQDLLEGVDDKQLARLRDLFDLGKTKGIADPLTLLDDPVHIKTIGEKEAAQLKTLGAGLKEISADWNIIEKHLADKGLLAEYVPIANYLPHHSQIVSQRRVTKELGPHRPGFTKHQELSLQHIARQDIEVMKFFLGTDEETAAKIVKELNWSTVNMDLREMFMYRAYAHARAVANADLVERFMQFGIRPEYLTQSQLLAGGIERAGEIAIPGLRQVQTEIPALKGMYFDNDVADIIDRVIPITTTDKGLRWWEKVVNYVTGQFKGWATLSPGFHLRNFRSNIFTGFVNYGAQMLNPNRIRKSIALSACGLYGKEQAMKYLSKLGFTEAAMNKILSENIAGKSAAQWVDEVAKKTGIISKASMGYNLDEFVEKSVKGQDLASKLNLFGNENIAFNVSHEIGGVIESAGKLQGFLIDLEKMAGKGGEAAQSMVDAAVANAKKYFFDYEDLSDFEKNVLKKVIPFYSWIRKNISLQVNTLVEKTGTMAAVAKLSKNAKAENIDERDLPEYLRGSGAIPFELTPEGITKVFMPDLPYKDLNQIPFKFDMSSGVPVPMIQYEDAYNNFLSMAHPIFKTMLATAGRGWDPFMRKDLDAQAPAPRAFRLLSDNPQVFAFLDSAMRVAGFDQGLGLEVAENGKLKMDGQMAKVLEDNFLLLKRLDDLGDTVTAIFPELDRQLEKLTGIKGRYDDADRVLKSLSFAAGISMKEIDLDKQEEFRFREALKRAEDAKRKDREKTPGAQTRSQAHYKSYQNRLRKMRVASGW